MRLKQQEKCLRHGADGLCAIDLYWPCVKDQYPEQESRKWREMAGLAWLTGSAVKPIALRYNYEIAGKYPDLMNLYGLQGFMTAEDAIEYMMAGARAVGI